MQTACYLNFSLWCHFVGVASFCFHAVYNSNHLEIYLFSFKVRFILYLFRLISKFRWKTAKSCCLVQIFMINNQTSQNTPLKLSETATLGYLVTSNWMQNDLALFTSSETKYVFHVSYLVWIHSTSPLFSNGCPFKFKV